MPKPEGLLSTCCRLLTKPLAGATIPETEPGAVKGPMCEGAGLPETDLRHELAVALRLARQAGEAIMRYYRAGLVPGHKPGNEPVTEADQEADRLIVAGLRAEFPDDGLLTEESDDDLSRLNKKRVWIVDPLDGTHEFLAQTGEFSVHIALVHSGRPVLGVVSQPAEGRLYYALEGRGAYQVDCDKTTRVHVSGTSVPAEMCMVASRSHFSPLVEAARQALGIQTLNRLGSVGAKVSLVARGESDLYLTTAVSKEWDFCAPHILLSEAGGVLTDLCGGPLTYNKANVIECTGLIASNGLAHWRIVEAVAGLRSCG
jgi:3'(2'), 5'-bisphosphate nucleotidase